MDTRRWKIRKVELAGGDGHECFEIVLAELRTQKKRDGETGRPDSEECWRDKKNM